MKRTKDRPRLQLSSGSSEGRKQASTKPKKHGDFTDVAEFVQGVLDLAEKLPGYRRASPVVREGFRMIVHKLARIASGDPFLPEHWEDICGYGQITLDRLVGKITRVR